MYKINNIDIRDYDIIPSNVSNSNIAITGIFDLPARIGTCYHVWSESDSIEAYVDEDDINFGGRDIQISGTLWSASQSDAITKTASFASSLNGNPTSILATGYGTYNVTLTDVKLNYWYNGKGSCTISFKENSPTINRVKPELSTPTPTVDCIDSYSFSSLGITLKSIQGIFDINGKREIKTTIPAYGGVKEREIEMQMLLIAPSLNDFQNRINFLTWIFGSEGIRTIKTQGVSLNCFAMNGFKVSNVWIKENTTGLLTIKLIVL